MSQYNKLSDIQYARFQILPVDLHFLFWSPGTLTMSSTYYRLAVCSPLFYQVLFTKHSLVRFDKLLGENSSSLELTCMFLCLFCMFSLVVIQSSCHAICVIILSYCLRLQGHLHDMLWKIYDIICYCNIPSHSRDRTHD